MSWHQPINQCAIFSKKVYSCVPIVITWVIYDDMLKVFNLEFTLTQDNDANIRGIMKGCSLLALHEKEAPY